MYFNTACLMMLQVWHTKDRGRISSDWLSKFAMNNQPISQLTTYTSEEVWIRATPVHTIAPLLSDFWQDKILATHLVDGRWIDEYTITTCLFELRPAAIRSLVEMNNVDYSKALDELSEKALPMFHGELVQSSYMRKSNISILYLEPDETLTTGLSDTCEGVCMMAEILRERLGQKGSVILPNFVNGMLLMHGIGVPVLEAVAVNFDRKRFKSEAGDLSLPDTVMNLQDYMACAHVYTHLNVRLARLPLYENNATQYLHSLGMSKGNSPRKGGSRRSELSRKLSSADELRFLEDRQLVMTERLSINQCTDAISAVLDSNIFSKVEQFPLLDTGSTSSFPYLRSFLASVKSGFKNGVRDIERKEKLIIAREAFLSDYLRDISLAATTRSNLNLQKSIKRLTLAAVVIALVTLLLTLVTIIPTVWPERNKVNNREIIQGR
jgi:hypothetical protein